MDQIPHRGQTGRQAFPADPDVVSRPFPVLWSLAALLTLGACASGPSEDILPGGIPARTNLHLASTLPPESVRTVARRAFGWRVMYHPDLAPAFADQRAARALCGLESRGVDRIQPVPRIDPTADPGAVIIDVICA